MSRARVDDILLVAYLDGELAPAAMAELERLLVEDAPTARRLEELRRSAALLRELMAEERFVAPSPAAPPLPRPPRRWVPAAAALAGLAAGILGAVLLLRPSTTPDRVASVLEEVAEYQAVFSRESEHLVEVPASRREHIEAWLGERTGLPLAVPDLSDVDLRFEGARMLVVDGAPVAQLVYTGRGGERVALCASRLEGSGARRTEFSGEGLHLVGVTRDGHLFIVAGPAGSRLVANLGDRLPDLLLRKPG